DRGSTVKKWGWKGRKRERGRDRESDPILPLHPATLGLLLVGIANESCGRIPIDRRHRPCSSGLLRTRLRPPRPLWLREQRLSTSLLHPPSRTSWSSSPCWVTYPSPWLPRSPCSCTSTPGPTRRT
ncbi:hypothetical protein IE53DRAFT_412156, partial [Violaceomyces palustris]